MLHVLASSAGRALSYEATYNATAVDVCYACPLTAASILFACCACTAACIHSCPNWCCGVVQLQCVPLQLWANSQQVSKADDQQAAEAQKEADEFVSSIWERYVVFVETAMDQVCAAVNMSTHHEADA